MLDWLGSLLLLVVAEATKSTASMVFVAVVVFLVWVFFWFIRTDDEKRSMKETASALAWTVLCVGGGYWLAGGLGVLIGVLILLLIAIINRLDHGFAKTHAYLVRIAMKDEPGGTKLETIRNPDGTYYTILSRLADPPTNIIVDPSRPEGSSR